MQTVLNEISTVQLEKTQEILQVMADTSDELRETVTWKIRKMNKIRSTLTLMKVEGQGE